MEIFKQGAEAVLKKMEYLGKATVLKERIPKKYRHPVLDAKIRRERTSIEARLINRAKKAGIRTPVVYSIDRKGTAILMEFIDGKRMKETLGKKNHLKFLKELGKEIAMLHNNSIIHGDLTTSNIIIHNKKLVFVDFGLGYVSSKTGDKATDLLVFKKTFLATHFNIIGGWEGLLKAYLANAEKGREIAAKIPEIEAKTRYS
jgi:Kae1-associated kinase Bud32